jgi:hypothetical protein
MSTQTVYLSHQNKEIVVQLSYDEKSAILVPCRQWRVKLRRSSALAATKKFQPTWSLLTQTLSPLAGLSQQRRMTMVHGGRKQGSWLGDTRTKRRTVCLQILQSLRLRVSTLFWRYWLNNSGFQTLGTLQQPFCKVIPSLVTFLSFRRLTLSAAMWLGV